MSRSARVLALLLAALLPLGCGATRAGDPPGAPDEVIATLPLDPPTFALRLRTALVEAGSFEVTLTHDPQGEARRVVGVWHAGASADRTREEMAWAEDASFPDAPHVINADGLLCLNRAARQAVSAAGMGSAVAVPDRPWACTATRGRDATTAAVFVQPLALWSPVRRLVALGRPSEVEHVGLEETSGEALDHYRFVTDGGMLGGDVQTYDVWLDPEHRMRIMETTRERWELSGFGQAAPVELPAAALRGELRRGPRLGIGSLRP